MQIEFDVVLEKQRLGYTAHVPALPGCISEGNTKTEAMRNIKEAIELFLEEKGKTKAKQLAGAISIGKATIYANA